MDVKKVVNRDFSTDVGRRSSSTGDQPQNLVYNLLSTEAWALGCNPNVEFAYKYFFVQIY